jgi:hypothetical protein
VSRHLAGFSNSWSIQSTPFVFGPNPVIDLAGIEVTATRDDGRLSVLPAADS